MILRQSSRMCAEPGCVTPTGRSFARYCDAHRWQKRGRPSTHKLTPEREAFLRAKYQPAKRGISAHIARVLGVPRWRVCKWAGQLALTGPQSIGRVWTDDEDAFLERHIGSRHPHWIAGKLNRSETSVCVRAKRLGISRRDAREWWTARQVADGFGVDPSTVVRWIERGWLAGKHQGHDHPDGRAAAWRIEEPAVRAFVREHPTAYSLAKVEQTWFLDLVFQGRAA